jgi:hypothetical protein
VRLQPDVWVAAEQKKYLNNGLGIMQDEETVACWNLRHSSRESDDKNKISQAREPDELRTEHLLNKSLDRYAYINLIDLKWQKSGY